MKRWEYRVESWFATFEGKYSDYDEPRVNEKALAQAGADGWELVSVVVHPACFKAIYKRPVAARRSA